MIAWMNGLPLAWWYYLRNDDTKKNVYNYIRCCKFCWSSFVKTSRLLMVISLWVLQTPANFKTIIDSLSASWEIILEDIFSSGKKVGVITSRVLIFNFSSRKLLKMETSDLLPFLLSLRKSNQPRATFTETFKITSTVLIF